MENDIRPEILMAKQKEMYQKDIERLLSKKDSFIDVDCPSCESNNKCQKFSKYELSYQKCRECGTVYISPRPSFEILMDYYNNSENYKYWNEYIFPATENSRREKIFKPRVHLLEDLVKRHYCGLKLFVEIGAGYGIFCEELKKQNYFQEIVAIEPTPFLAETCRNKGLKVIEEPVEKVKFNEQADVIANFEVIEHLFSPKEFLTACFNNLSKNGILITSCPNIEGFDVVILKELSDVIDTEHLNYFSLESLSGLLESIGFLIIEKITPGELDVDIVRNKIISGQFQIDQESFLHKIIMDKIIGNKFQRFLSDNCLSSNMLIVARRP